MNELNVHHNAYIDTRLFAGMSFFARVYLVSESADNSSIHCVIDLSNAKNIHWQSLLIISDNAQIRPLTHLDKVY